MLIEELDEYKFKKFGEKPKITEKNKTFDELFQDYELKFYLQKLELRSLIEKKSKTIKPPSILSKNVHEKEEEKMLLKKEIVGEIGAPLTCHGELNSKIFNFNDELKIETQNLKVQIQRKIENSEIKDNYFFIVTVIFENLQSNADVVDYNIETS